MKNFIKNLTNLIKGKDKTDLSTAFNVMEQENKEAEKSYGEKFFPNDEKINKLP